MLDPFGQQKRHEGWEGSIPGPAKIIFGGYIAGGGAFLVHRTAKINAEGLEEPFKVTGVHQRAYEVRGKPETPRKGRSKLGNQLSSCFRANLVSRSRVRTAVPEIQQANGAGRERGICDRYLNIPR